MISRLSRRSLITACTLAPLGFGKPNAIRLGGPIFLKSEDPVELAREHRRLGYSAAYCPPVKLSEKERIRAIESAFRDARVVISEVGAWKNMLDPDTVKRKENL